MTMPVPPAPERESAAGRRPLVFLTAVGLAVVIILAIVLWKVRSPEITLSASVAAPATKPAPVPPRQIRVGVVVSLYRPKGPGTPQPPSPNQARIVERELTDPSLQVVPIIDPGTADDPAIAALLSEFFPGAAPVDGYDAEQLKELDVIVANMLNAARPELLDAIEQAVRDGTGLVTRQGFASFEPGFTPQVCRLLGLQRGQYAYRAYTEVPATIVGAHPLLGDLSGQVGHALTVRPNGAYGVLAENSVPLIELDDVREVEPVGQTFAGDTSDFVFYPLYVSQLGEGKLVICSFQGFKPAPEDLDAATGWQFMIRAVRWAARNPGPER